MSKSSDHNGRQSFSAQFSDKLRQLQSSPDYIAGLWANIFHSLRASDKALVGFERPPKRNQWHDEEYRAVFAAKNDAYKRTLQSAATRAIVEHYRRSRREERRLIRHKKREQERRDREEIGMYKSRNDAEKFFKNVKHLTEGFKPGASACRDERGNLVTGAKVMEGSLFYVIARRRRY